MGTVFNYSFWSKMKRHISSSVVLIFFTILALMCANIQGVKDWYFALWQNPVSLSIGDFNLFSHNGHPLTLKFVSLPAGTTWKAFASVCVVCGSVISAILGCVLLNKTLPKS